MPSRTPPTPRPPSAKKNQNVPKKAPLAISNRSKMSAPRTQSVPNGTIISHSEICVSSVLASPAYNVLSSLAIQPAIETYSKGSPIFTWLPQIAKQYDNYEFLKLKFTYYTSASSLKGGLVMMAFEPNPDSSAPLEFASLRSMHSVTGAIRENLVFDISNYVKGKKLLTRRSVVNGLPLYDLGKVFLATSDGDNTNSGYLEVSYSVRLTNPQASISAPPAPVLPTPYPTQVLVNSYFSGGSNVAPNCVAYSNLFLGNTPLLQGAPLVTITTAAIPSISLTDYLGSQFISPSVTAASLTFLRSGRYRFSVQISGDFEDLKMFSFLPIHIPFGGTPIPAKTALYDFNSAYTLHNCIPTGHRGFTGTAVLDPNPGTDLPLLASWDIEMGANDRLLPALGVLKYNSVSTTTANFTFRAETGASFFKIEYLGPSALEP